MSLLTRLSTKVGLASALLAVGALVAASPADAGNRPTLEFTYINVDSGLATVAYTINRGTQQIATRACALGDVPVDCGATPAPTSTRSDSIFSTQFSAPTLPAVLTITVTLTDGGSVTSSSVLDSYTGVRSACATLGGQFVGEPLGEWHCYHIPLHPTESDPYASAEGFGYYQALPQYCLLDRYTAGITSFDYTEMGISCWSS